MYHIYITISLRGAKMIKQRFISAVMAAAVAVSSVTALSAGVSAEWVKSDSGYSYKSDDTGKKLTGWQTIGDGTYYFDKKGIALTGWKKIGDDTYYFNSAKKGKMLTGWSKIGSSKYYFGKDGKMRTGFVKLSGDTYYFGKNGKMRTGKLKISGKTYDFGTDGILKNGSKTSSSSDSVLTAPLDGLKWGMSQEQVIKKGGFKSYYAQDSILMVADSEPYAYYVFNADDELCAVGYAETYSACALKKYKGYFTSDGWEKMATYSEASGTNILYQKGTKVGSVTYNDETIMTLVFSDEYGKMLSEGNTDCLDGLF